AADRRQADPEYRYAFALERGDRLVDALRIDLRPLVGAEFDHAVRPFAGLRLGRRNRVLLVVGLVLFLRVLVVRRRLACLVLFLFLVRFLRQVALTDILAIADAE